MAMPPSTTTAVQRQRSCDPSVCAVGALMTKARPRGVAALEFCLVAVPLFALMFAIFDLGRYAITMQSLWCFRVAGARALMIDNCYVNAELQRVHLPAPVATCLLPRKCKWWPPSSSWRSRSYTDHGCRSRCTYRDGVSTGFHHVDADMGHSTQRAERVHLNSLLADATGYPRHHPRVRLDRPRVTT